MSKFPAFSCQISRGVAQPGSAPQWGCGGRRFKSSRPDQYLSSSISSTQLHPYTDCEYSQTSKPSFRYAAKLDYIISITAQPLDPIIYTK